MFVTVRCTVLTYKHWSFSELHATDNAGVEVTRYRVTSKLTTHCCLRSCRGCTGMSCTPSLALLIVEIHQLLSLPRVLPPLPRATSSLALSLYTYVDMNECRIRQDTYTRLRDVRVCAYVIDRGEIKRGRFEERERGADRKGPGTCDYHLSHPSTSLTMMAWDI